jgi:ribosomal protein S18 acetylase RimI-like enzyme
MPVTYRPARPEEYDEAGRVLTEAYLSDGLIPARSDYARHLADVATRAKQAEVVVATEDDAIVGTVTFCPQGSPLGEVAQPGEGEFRMLGVAVSARGRGIGEGLTRYCIERSRELDYHAVVLSSRPQMRAAHRLYERLGFTRAPELDWAPLPGVDLLGFRLELTVG